MRLLISALIVKFLLVKSSIVLDDCLLREDEGSPYCFTKIVGTPRIVCISKGVARIQGQYERIHIFCESKNSLHFLYQGVEPTEAVFPVLKKSFNQTDRSLAYSLELRIFGIRAQYEYYKNKSNKISLVPKVYPRSGRYKIYNAHNVTLSSSIYLFIEEPELLAPTFLKNSEMTIAKRHNRCLIIPCKPSHYNSTVALFLNDTIQLAGNYTFSPDVGLTSTFSEPGKYTCLLYAASSLDTVVDTLVLEYPIHKRVHNLPWGYEGMLPRSENLDEGIILKFDKRIVDGIPHATLHCGNTGAKIQTGMRLGIAMSSGIVGALKLIKAFVSPKYYNLSYNINLGFPDSRNQNEIFVTPSLPPRGVIVSACIYGKDYRAGQTGLSFNGIVHTYGYNRNFVKDWDWDLAPPKWFMKLSLKEDYPSLYAGIEVTFTCAIHAGGLVPPVFWYTETANGRYKQEAVHDDVGDEIFSIIGRSTLTLILTKDIQKVGCATTIFFSKMWKNVTTDIHTVEAELPQIVRPQDESTVTFNAWTEKVLRCEATGIPHPLVYWGHEGLNLTAPTLNFSTVQMHGANIQGKYTCIAFNIFGEQEVTLYVVDEGDSVFRYVLLGAVSLLFLGLGGLLAYCLHIRHERNNPATKLTKVELDEFFNGIDDNSTGQLPGVSSIDASEFHSCPYLQKYEIRKENLDIDYTQLYGEGQFGIVLKGYHYGKPVAVKTVRTGSDKRYVKAILSELKIMMYIGVHDNLIDLVGANTKERGGGVVFRVTPFCELGCLQGYLRKHRGLFAIGSRYKGVVPRRPRDSGPAYQNDVMETKVDADVPTMDYIDLLKWAAQIASGMGYLEGKVIHGDLAVRNILLDSNRCAKITDFGLSRKMYGYADYVKKNSEPLPWRHMALESLKDLAFSSKSDCWAYGVTVWEIFSLAETPYPGYVYDIGFVNALEDGLRMKKPKYLPEELYELVLVPCWNSYPSERPSFGTLRQIFWQEISKTTGFPLLN